MLIKAADHIQELHGKLHQSKQIADNLNMTESQVVDGGLSGFDIQEQEKMLAEAKAQHDAQKKNRRELYQAEEGLAAGAETDFDVVTSSMISEQQAEWDRLKKEINQIEKDTEAGRKPYSKTFFSKQMPQSAIPVNHGPTSGAELPHNASSTLPISHQSDLSAVHHNQCKPSNDQQYQNHINTHPPTYHHQGSRSDHELQQYKPHDTHKKSCCASS